MTIGTTGRVCLTKEGVVFTVELFSASRNKGGLEVLGERPKSHV